MWRQFFRTVLFHSGERKTRSEKKPYYAYTGELFLYLDERNLMVCTKNNSIISETIRKTNVLNVESGDFRS